MAWFRQTAFWLGIILISLSWRVTIHMVTAPDAGLALLASLIGTSCFVVSGALSPCAAPSRPRAGLASLVAAGALFLVTGISTGVLLRIAPGLHDIPLPQCIAPLVERAWPRLSLVNGLAGFWDGRELHQVRVTFEGLGLYEVWYIAVGIAFTHAVSGSRRPALLVMRSLGTLAIYAAFRFIALAAVAMEFARPDLIWQPAVVLVSYLPLAPLLAPRRGGASGNLVLSGRRLGVAGAVVIALLSATTLSGVGYSPVSREVTPARVVIDETRSNWEWVTQPFDTASFGIRAEYNYYCFAEYLGEFHDVSVIEDGVTPAALDACDVLIVKTPTRPYPPHEIDAIVEFVRLGGGLLLIGDHNNLFGMTTYLNAIAERFGMRFRSDDTFDLATGGFSPHIDLGLWTHPAVRGLRGFKFLTSCTIEAGPGAEPVMLGVGLGSEDGDYGHPNFFGNISYDLADRFGVFLQAAARRFGRGRVLLFTDSTCFSNFCMFSPGTPDLALALVGLLAGHGAVEAASCGAVLVDTTHSRASFFDYMGLNGRPTWQHFEEFYLSFARMGARPFAGGLAGLENGSVSCLVIVNPRGGFTDDEIERVTAFVARGGRLLVLDSVLNSESVANQLLQGFGMGVITGPDTDASSPGLVPRLQIVGGKSVRIDSAGWLLAARAVRGSGTVVVAVDSYPFSEEGLGKALRPARIYERHAAHYRALFCLLGHLL